MTVVRGDPLAVPAADLPASVVALVQRSVERNPDREAIRWKAPGGWSSWTYRQLWDQVAAASIGLRGLGMGAGDRVVILSRSRPEWLVADLACQALGAVTCPLYPGDPPARLASLSRAVGARWFIVEDARLLARLRSGMGDAPLPGPVVLFDAHDGGGLPALADLAVAPSSAALDSWERRGVRSIPPRSRPSSTPSVPTVSPSGWWWPTATSFTRSTPSSRPFRSPPTTPSSRCCR